MAKAEISHLLSFNDFKVAGTIIAESFRRSHRLWSPLKIVLAPLDVNRGTKHHILWLNSPHNSEAITLVQITLNDQPRCEGQSVIIQTLWLLGFKEILPALLFIPPELKSLLFRVRRN